VQLLAVMSAPHRALTPTPKIPPPLVSLPPDTVCSEEQTNLVARLQSTARSPVGKTNQPVLVAPRSSRSFFLPFLIRSVAAPHPTQRGNMKGKAWALRLSQFVCVNLARLSVFTEINSPTARGPTLCQK